MMGAPNPGPAILFVFLVIVVLALGLLALVLGICALVFAFFQNTRIGAVITIVLSLLLNAISAGLIIAFAIFYQYGELAWGCLIPIFCSVPGAIAAIVLPIRRRAATER